MDKEFFISILPYLSEHELITIYKIQKINNFGFRANTSEDIKKNRKILESNLLKAINFKVLQKYVVEINEKLDIEELSKENFQEFVNKYGLFKLSLTLYLDEKHELLESYLNSINTTISMGIKPSKKAIANSINESDSESKSLKIIKRLEDKITNLNDELEKRDKQYKTLLDEKKQELTSLRSDKNNLNIRISELTKNNLEITNDNGKLITENNKLKNDLSISNELLKEKIISIEHLQTQLTQALESNTIDSNTNNLESYKREQIIKSNQIQSIAIIGEYTKFIIEQLPSKKIIFFKLDTIENLKNTINEFSYLWIINYDLTRKEQKSIKNILSSDLQEIEKFTVETLKELNSLIATFKEKDDL